MEIYRPSTDANSYQENQKFEVFEQVLDQKKVIFKQLRSEVAILGQEIEELQKEQRKLAILNARQSLKVCVSVE